jgi:outer membrane PBP1 activator LpoA protein
MNLRFASHLISIALLGAALAACAPTTRPPATSSVDQQAQTLIDAGKPAAAAELYLQAARKAQPPLRQQLQMRAAGQLIDDQQFDRARSILDSIDPQGLNAEDLAHKALLNARLELALRQPEAALNALPTDTTDLPDALTADLLQMRAKAAAAAGMTLDAARARLDRQPLLQGQDASDNLHALWALFTQATPDQLQGWQQSAQREDLKAWLALALIAKDTAPRMQALSQALDAWKTQYPAQQQMTAPIIEELNAQWQAFQTYPSQIAVLLPLSGPFSPVARTILDGIMNAYYAHQDPAHPVALHVYDTGAQPSSLLSLYAQAVSNGAQFVIGPLDRNQVSRLAASGIVTVPTLALNYVNDPTAKLPNRFYEFGLSPGNEAEQVAEKASLDGHLKAVVLVPHNDWGSRVAAAFKQRFQELGGQVLAVGDYKGNASDFSPAIVSALNIDSSDARARAVSRTIHRAIKFDARRRQDVDMIFIAGDPRQARLLMPQIDFHHGTGLPVYSIADAFSGTPDPVADRDLNGLIFCDAPLLLSDTGKPAAARAAMLQNFPNASRRYPRLFGLGVDSFNVIPYLKRLAGQGWARFDGLSGALHMVDGHRLERQLLWAQFKQGVPQLQGISAVPTDNASGSGQGNGASQ